MHEEKRFSVEQIVAVLKQAELGVPVAEVIRKVGISEQTFYRCEGAVCRDGDGSGSSAEATPGREQPVEAVGRRSELGQDDAPGCAEKKVLRPSGRHPMVDHLRAKYWASERHACRVLLMVRGTYRYHCHPEPWTELRMRMREIAQSRVRYGYRKIRVLLNREGWNVGKYLVYRLYKEEGLALKKRPQRKRKAVRHREERFIATAPNQAWSIDFVADQLQDGTRFRALTIGSQLFRDCNQHVEHRVIVSICVRHTRLEVRGSSLLALPIFRRQNAAASVE
ncbi:transposase [Silvibacterium bohemicum]|uniref:Transposase n=1 Tax=Silvibacterium bohemicum TaxID=1577686 RepID=A0A841K1D7_9BACT|nr:transposase [Silvibacterium bohemicum]